VDNVKALNTRGVQPGRLPIAHPRKFGSGAAMTPRLSRGARYLPLLDLLGALPVADPCDPSCPRCGSRLHVHDDSTCGVSIRCPTERCRLGRLGWLWPEHWAAEAWGSETIREAERRILNGAAPVEGTNPWTPTSYSPSENESQDDYAAFVASLVEATHHE
jgi:hypothetical protein